MAIREAVRRLPAYRFEPHVGSVKLDQNESPDDPGDELAVLLARRLSDLALNRYPPLRPVELELAIAARHSWDPEGVVVAGGSNVLIQALVVAAGLGRSVITVAPNFAVYAAQARLLAAELVEVPLGPGFAVPTADIVASLGGRRGVVFLADPLAPTGNAAGPEDLATIAAAAARTGGWLSVIDEAYADFSGADHSALARSTPGVVLLRTFSKAAALAGMRIGYALASAEVAENLRKVLLPFSVGAPQVAAGLLALERPDLVAARVSRAVRERERIAAALARLPGVSVYPSVTNFVLFRVPDAERVHRELLASGVVVRRQDHLPGLAGCLRVSAGTPAETDAFLASIETSLAAAVRGG